MTVPQAIATYWQQGRTAEAAEDIVIVRVLITFYVERLTTDEPCVAATLGGLLTFERWFAMLERGQLEQIMSAILQLNVQRYSQTTRYTAFRLIDWLITSCTTGNGHARQSYAVCLAHRACSVAVSETFASLDVVGGFIQVMDGEKDPRNLLLAFSIAQKLIRQFDITQHVEVVRLHRGRCCFIANPWTWQDLFEILFCYFPITFRPPPHDPYGITADDLKLALRRSLAATPLFGPMALPMLTEKLSSSLGSAKIFNAIDDGVVASALGTLRAMAQVMSRTDEPDAASAEHLINTVLGCIKKELDRAPATSNESQQYRAIASIIRAIGGASVTQTVMPAAALLPYKEDMLQLFGTAYTSTAEYDQLRRTGLEGMRRLLFSSGLLLPNEAGILVQQVIHVILEQLNTPDEELSELRLNSVELLADYALQRPMVVKDVVFPPCIAQLAKAVDLAATRTRMEEVPRLVRSKVQMALQVMSACAVTTLLFEDVLLQWLDVVDHLETTVALDEDSGAGGTINQWLLHQLLQSACHVYQAVEEGAAAAAVPSVVVIVSPSFYTTMLTFLWSKAIEPTITRAADAPGASAVKSLFVEGEIISVMARLLGEGMRQLNEEQQQVPLSLAIKLYTQGDISQLTCSSKADIIPFTPPDAAPL
ncbi:Dos2-interacting transcription regulator of RNA-Pol-II-domain-containing protein [Syncephalis pseudoplumigaleata]|uniref:MMS19 nucleotide excision repair protein n=1 Tax=Syncephalis pseudoplumigaleata TaxID=1712513 RepID=A0A4P9YZS7_9FUNG|nr:Dos2-interacting transcription regulator of RNA-Pol-II-domain-containing protein [Syncephalis pseudoplumigaleata]|eukprot:RKP25614.1 Dos2-interacting transcription regulator of RNA-Pol-II-domain-containing protein [Syncephalis pseudoplumigaleata]